MSKLKTCLLLLLLIAIIAGTIFGVWKSAFFIASQLSEIDPSVLAAIIGAMATVFVGIFAVLLTQHQTKLKEIAEAHREKKVEIYDKFLAIIIKLIKGSNENIKCEPVPQDELIEFLVDFKREILLWGSPKVIKAQLHYESVSHDPRQMFYAVDSLYRAIREDIGLSNKGLEPLDLFKLFLKDHQEIHDFLDEASPLSTK